MAVDACIERLEIQCGSGRVKPGARLDACGGHGAPYHYHRDLSCMYDGRSSADHSPLLGVAMDGHGIYGRWEGNGTCPSLDACNGHAGVVPSSDLHGTKTSTVYHYHTSGMMPFTIGCYGPVDSLDACKPPPPQVVEVIASASYASVTATEVDDSHFIQQFTANFKETVGSSAGVATHDVVIKGLMAGSIVVDFVVRMTSVGEARTFMLAMEASPEGTLAAGVICCAGWCVAFGALNPTLVRAQLKLR
eukprot:gene5036-6137_t